MIRNVTKIFIDLIRFYLYIKRLTIFFQEAIMKKIFIFLSTFLLSFFFIWIIQLRAPQYLYASYDSVTLTRLKKDAKELTREVFEQKLEEFVNEESSLIARRIVEPSKDGNTNFTYATYGKGDLPIKQIKKGENNGILCIVILFCQVL